MSFNGVFWGAIPFQEAHLLTLASVKLIRCIQSVRNQSDTSGVLRRLVVPGDSGEEQEQLQGQTKEISLL